MPFIVEIPVSTLVDPSGVISYISRELVQVTDSTIETNPPTGYPACPRSARCLDGTSSATHHLNGNQLSGEICPIIQQLPAQPNKLAVCLRCGTPH